MAKRIWSPKVMRPRNESGTEGVADGATMPEADCLYILNCKRCGRAFETINAFPGPRLCIDCYRHENPPIEPGRVDLFQRLRDGGYFTPAELDDIVRHAQLSALENIEEARKKQQVDDTVYYAEMVKEALERVRGEDRKQILGDIRAIYKDASDLRELEKLIKEYLEGEIT